MMQDLMNQNLKSILSAPLVLLFSLSAQAQDCTGIATEKVGGKTLEQLIAFNIEKSPFTASEILVGSMSRLGYGINARSTLNPVALSKIEKVKGKKFAAQKIAEAIVSSLKNADKMSAKVNERIEAAYPKTYGSGTSGRVDMIVKELNRLKSSGNRDGEAAYSSDLKRSIIARKILAALTVKDYNAGEVLSDFWFNHLNVSDQKTRLHSYEITLRGKLCGTFNQLLLSSARHQAMSQYLDNAFNKVGAINENYAREIIELHTIGSGPIVAENGVNKQVYTQAEVYEAARVLSGWGASDFQGFVFDNSKHDKGDKKFPVLLDNTVYKGGSSAQANEQNGIDFIAQLSRHSATKRNICRKLIVHLTGGVVTSDILGACKEAYGVGGDLKAMYVAILAHPDFWNEKTMFKGYKNPFELMMSADRALGLTDIEKIAGNVTEFRQFIEIQGFKGLEAMGQPIYRIGAPTGYDIGAAFWKTPVVISGSMDQIFRATDYVNYAHVEDKKQVSGLELERAVTARKNRNTGADLYQFVTTEVMPIFANPEELPERASMIALIEEKKVDRKGTDPLPVRSLATQILSSATFLKK